MKAAEVAVGEITEQVATRVRARRSEIEQALEARIHGVSEPPESADLEYLQGLREAVPAAFEYGLAALQSSRENAPPPPVALLTQARLAARNGVQLSTVVRRYVAGYTMLGEYIAAEARASNLESNALLNRLSRTQAAAFDRLIAAVSEEYALEADSQKAHAPSDNEMRIQRLLDGELPDTTDIGYDFDANHLGVIVSGSGPMEIIRALSTALNCRSLTLHRDERTVWAWLGSIHELTPIQIQRETSSLLRVDSCERELETLAFGEAGRGLGGWRLTHRQARAAFPIGLRGSARVVHYADVALLASVLQDDLLVTSLQELYLTPLQQAKDGGAAALGTLRAYIDAQRNVTSTAAALGVNRNTVANRLRRIEDTIGRPLSSCGLEMEAALRLAER
jgi:hypothetical protein